MIAVLHHKISFGNLVFDNTTIVAAEKHFATIKNYLSETSHFSIPFLHPLAQQFFTRPQTEEALFKGEFALFPLNCML